MESAVFLGKVGRSISREDLADGIYGRYRLIFLIVEDEPHNPEMSRKIPAGDYRVLRVHGTHSEAAAQYDKLMREIRGRGMRVCGNSAEITLIDYGMTADRSKFITEIQIPVQSY